MQQFCTQAVHQFLRLRIEDTHTGEMKYSREPIYHLTSSFTLVFPQQENDTPSNNAAWVLHRERVEQGGSEMMHMLSCLKLATPPMQYSCFP